MTTPVTFQKPKRLIEEVDKDPLHVIEKVFAEIDRDFLQEILRKWLCHALAINQPPYKMKEQQLQLLFFHDELITLIEALYFITEKTKPEQELLSQLRNELEKYPQYNQTISETIDQMLVVKRFYRLFRIEYVRSELWDWLVVAMLYDEQRPQGLKVEAIIWVYEWVQYLTEAAFRTIQRQTTND